MSLQMWTYLIVGATFALYIGIAWGARVKDTKGFYVAGGGVPPLANGMATAADWMSAASFISMAGMISFMGYSGCMYLMGWTGGYVLLALLLAPYLRKFGKFTVPDFVGDRYYSSGARVVALICAIFISLTYVAGQMRGVGIVFSRFLEVDVNTGVMIGMVLVFFYSAIGGMKGITWTQVAQYCVLITAFIIPAVAISLKLTGNPIPQMGFGDTILAGPDAGKYLLDTLNQIGTDLGFTDYTTAIGPGTKPMLDVFAITMCLMVGTAGLPHVIIRFYTVPTVRAARLSAFYALIFIAILYTAAPALGAFARYTLINALNNQAYSSVPSWFANWEKTGLLAWMDKNNDGIITYRAGAAFKGKPIFSGETGQHGQRMIAMHRQHQRVGGQHPADQARDFQQLRGGGDVHPVEDPRRARGEDVAGVGEVDGLGDVVRDEEDRVVLDPRDVEEEPLHPPPRHRVERAERLVHQDDARLVHERPGDRDALLHPAREVFREALREVEEADLLQHLAGAVAAFFRVDAPELQAVLDVLLDRQPAERRVGLEDHAAVLRGAADRLAVEDIFSFIRHI